MPIVAWGYLAAEFAIIVVYIMFSSCLADAGVPKDWEGRETKVCFSLCWRVGLSVRKASPRTPSHPWASMARLIYHPANPI